MQEALISREKCNELIRSATLGDEFMTRYALMYAMESLDLDALNRLVDAVETTVREIPSLDSRVKALRLERFGI
jgi:hypothetical protein